MQRLHKKYLPIFPSHNPMANNKITGEMAIQKGVKRFLKLRKKINFLLFAVQFFNNKDIGKNPINTISKYLNITSKEYLSTWP